MKKRSKKSRKSSVQLNFLRFSLSDFLRLYPDYSCDIPSYLVLAFLSSPDSVSDIEVHFFEDPVTGTRIVGGILPRT